MLGAGCPIGAALAAAFARGNELVLAGRNAVRLSAVEKECRECGASRVRTLIADLSDGNTEPLLAAGPVHLVVNAAAATARVYDRDIDPAAFIGHARSDLLVPAQYLTCAARINGSRPPDVIFISTILTAFRSPERQVYSSLKRLQEEFLESYARRRPEVQVLTVRVGRLIPFDRPSAHARKLAEAVRAAYKNGERRMYFGWSGRVLAALFYVQPMAVLALLKLRRARNRPG